MKLKKAVDFDDGGRATLKAEVLTLVEKAKQEALPDGITGDGGESSGSNTSAGLCGRRRKASRPAT
jgi:hypothetical protein